MNRLATDMVHIVLLLSAAEERFLSSEKDNKKAVR